MASHLIVNKMQSPLTFPWPCLNYLVNLISSHSTHKQSLWLVTYSKYNCSCILFFFFKILFIYSWETQRGRDKGQSSGEAGSMQGARRGTPIPGPQDHALGWRRRQTPEPPGLPCSCILSESDLGEQGWNCISVLIGHSEQPSTLEGLHLLFPLLRGSSHR